MAASRVQAEKGSYLNPFGLSLSKPLPARRGVVPGDLEIAYELVIKVAAAHLIRAKLAIILIAFYDALTTGPYSHGMSSTFARSSLIDASRPQRIKPSA